MDAVTPPQGFATSSGKQSSRPPVNQVLDELLFYFNVDTETGLITVKRPRAKGKPIGEVATFIGGGGKGYKGYPMLTICKKKLRAHHLIWIVVNNSWPIYEIDHIDGDHLNNSIHNLRDVPKQLNQRNATSRKNNTSGCPNVYWKSTHKKWVVGFKLNKQTYEVGAFSTFAEAVEARNNFFKNNPHGFTKRHGQTAHDTSGVLPTIQLGIKIL